MASGNTIPIYSILSNFKMRIYHNNVSHQKFIRYCTDFALKFLFQTIEPGLLFIIMIIEQIYRNILFLWLQMTKKTLSRFISFFTSKTLGVDLFLCFFCDEFSTFLKHATFGIRNFNLLAVYIRVVILSKDIVHIGCITLEMYILAFYLRVKRSNDLNFKSVIDPNSKIISL